MLASALWFGYGILMSPFVCELVINIKWLRVLNNGTR